MTNTAGSCVLGLTQVAVGQKTALIQPHQGPWDYAAGIPLVIEAGGMVIFFHYRNGILEFIESPDLQSFNPRIRKLGFIAGSPQAVPEIRTLLEETFIAQK